MKNKFSKIELQNILKGDRKALSKAITLIESTLAEDIIESELLISEILPQTGKAIKIAITGPPGVGKSSFIEVFGNYLTSLGKKVAVISIDPSSEISKGSILGDKTRMETLANNPLAFIRPSPNNGYLGGLNIKCRENVILCDAAGYDIILIETVGVGQSETLVHGLVDYFLLLYSSNSGDEVQGIKKGILEHANAVIVTKADYENAEIAQNTQQTLENAFHIFENMKIPISVFSIFKKELVINIWENIVKYIDTQKKNNQFETKRKNQQINWMHEILKTKLISNYYQNLVNDRNIKAAEKQILENKITPYEAVYQIFNK